MITLEQRNDVAIVRLDDGKANTLEPESLDAFVEVLDDARRAGSRAMVLTGSRDFFSAGVNLRRVLREGPRFSERLLPAVARAFEALFRYPRPVVAAVNGHAVAGGALLVCACDHRMVADGQARLGFPELRAGLPMVGISLELARHVVPSHHLEDVLFRGELYLPPAAAERGLVDEIVPAGTLLDRALKHAEELAAIPAESYWRTKEELREPVLRRIDEGRARFEREIPGVWASEEVRRHLREYVRETLRK